MSEQAGPLNNNYWHGLSRHPLYGRWYRMMRRCYGLLDPAYHNYGGRGITVCEQWHDVAAYIAYVETELGVAPTKAHQLDRINNNQGYEPGNLRWASRSTQNANQRQRVCDGYPVGATGERGIKLTRQGRYQARVSRGGRAQTIGTFATLEEAVAARQAALA